MHDMKGGRKKSLFRSGPEMDSGGGGMNSTWICPAAGPDKGHASCAAPAFNCRISAAWRSVSATSSVSFAVIVFTSTAVV